MAAADPGPLGPVHNYHADGVMRLEGSKHPDAFYEPNSFDGSVQDQKYREPPLKLSGDAAYRYDHRAGNDDYRQPGDLFQLMTPDQKDQLFHNIKAAMEGVPLEIVKRQLVHFYKADPEYGIGVAARMGLTVSDLPSAVAAE
jgi:catalase